MLLTSTFISVYGKLDRRFKKTGVRNVYMPLLIPESLLNKEKDHVNGFAPEVAWVTNGGSEKLEERLYIVIKDINYKIIDKSIYWFFDDLKESLDTKQVFSYCIFCLFVI